MIWGSDTELQQWDPFLLKAFSVCLLCCWFQPQSVTLFAILLHTLPAPEKLSHKFTSSHCFCSSKQCRCEGCKASSRTSVPTRDRWPVSAITLPKCEEVADNVLGLQILRRLIQNLIIPVKKEEGCLVLKGLEGVLR